jgi:hypothetical protein
MSETPLIERVRELTLERAGLDDPLYFYPVAIELGASEAEAERMDRQLTGRMMRAAGMI